MTYREAFSEVIRSAYFSQQVKNIPSIFMLVCLLLMPATYVTIFFYTVHEVHIFGIGFSYFLIVVHASLSLALITVIAVELDMNIRVIYSDIKKDTYLNQCELLYDKLGLSFAYECANKFDLCLCSVKIKTLAEDARICDILGRIFNTIPKEAVYERKMFRVQIENPNIDDLKYWMFVEVNHKLVITGKLFHD